MSNNYGPQWTVNSDEVGGGVVILLLFFGAILVLAPAFVVGMIIGTLIWDVKIVKYPLGALFAYGHFLLLSYAWDLSHELCAALVIVSWLVMDYMMARGRVRDMVVVKTFRGMFGWLFSA